MAHPRPFFAPIAAAIALSTSRIQRSRRIVQMVSGVLLGIGIGELLRDAESSVLRGALARARATARANVGIAPRHTALHDRVVGVAVRTSAGRLCHVLVEDLDLAEAVPPGRRDQATEDCTARELSLASGSWEPPSALAGDGIGLLVLQGLIIRRVSIDGRFGVELLGECDVLRPWQDEDTQTLPLKTVWFVLEPVRIALLDGRFTRQLGRHPELASRLFERAVRRSRRLVVNLAIVHQARVDDRLHMMFWHFAGRWGRVRHDGVLLPLRLTHAVLADLVAARRPTVTSALSDLSRRGLVHGIDDGWLLTGPSPKEDHRLAVASANPTRTSS